MRTLGMVFGFEFEFKINSMKTASLFLLSFFFGFSILSCETDDMDDSDSKTILGDWDIETGGILHFEKDSFSTTAGCNNLFGNVIITEKKIQFSLVASTLKGCPEEEGKREEELASMFNNALLTYTLEENKAYLFNEEGKEILVLVRPENATLINDWTLVSIRVETGITASILDVNSGMSFLKEGNVQIQTACNSGQGEYTVKENSLNFKALAFTEKACETERNTREKEFTQAIIQTNGYSILRKTLRLEKDGKELVTLKLKE